MKAVPEAARENAINSSGYDIGISPIHLLQQRKEVVRIGQLSGAKEFQTSRSRQHVNCPLTYAKRYERHDPVISLDRDEMGPATARGAIGTPPTSEPFPAHE